MNVGRGRKKLKVVGPRLFAHGRGHDVNKNRLSFFFKLKDFDPPLYALLDFNVFFLNLPKKIRFIIIIFIFFFFLSANLLLGE